MKIVGIDNMTVGELVEEVNKGGRFVIFQYAISVIVISFKNPTDIYFVRAGEGTLGKSLGPTLISLILGWWGFPFGIIFTFESLFINFRGGRNVTGEVMNSLLADTHAEPSPSRPWARGQNG